MTPTKADTPDNSTVAIPDGWVVVYRGRIKPGDRYLHQVELTWCDCDLRGMRKYSFYREVGPYACVIRKQEDTDHDTQD